MDKNFPLELGITSDDLLALEESTAAPLCVFVSESCSMDPFAVEREVVDIIDVRASGRIVDCPSARRVLVRLVVADVDCIAEDEVVDDVVDDVVEVPPADVPPVDVPPVVVPMVDLGLNHPVCLLRRSSSACFSRCSHVLASHA